MEMACDLQGTMGEQTMLKMHTKIYKFDPHELTYPVERFMVGFSGNSEANIEVVDFFAYPEAYGAPPRVRSGAVQGLVLTESGKLFYFTNPAKWLRLKDKVFAIGSGSHVALGALHAGASPRDSVKAAIKVDPFSGMGTKVLKF